MNKNVLKRVYDFYLWLDGFCAALESRPTDKQWEAIKDNMRFVFKATHGTNDKFEKDD